MNNDDYSFFKPRLSSSCTASVNPFRNWQNLKFFRRTNVFQVVHWIKANDQAIQLPFFRIPIHPH